MSSTSPSPHRPEHTDWLWEALIKSLEKSEPLVIAPSVQEQWLSQASELEKTALECFQSFGWVMDKNPLARSSSSPEKIKIETFDVRPKEGVFKVRLEWAPSYTDHRIWRPWHISRHQQVMCECDLEEKNLKLWSDETCWWAGLKIISDAYDEQSNSTYLTVEINLNGVTEKVQSIQADLIQKAVKQFQKNLSWAAGEEQQKFLVKKMIEALAEGNTSVALGFKEAWIERGLSASKSAPTVGPDRVSTGVEGDTFEEEGSIGESRSRRPRL